jgi:predicted lipid-binding transport protein (Tim44 family)
MFKKRWVKSGLILFVFYFLASILFSMDASARVGGGRSSGSRGSRPSSPSRPYSTPSPTQPPRDSASQQRSLSQPVQQPQGGFWRGVAGGVMGGIIGGMLFRSMGFGGGFGGAGGGIGLFEIILVLAIILGIFWYIKRRRQPVVQDGYYQSSAGMGEPAYQPSAVSDYERTQGEEGNLERGLDYIRQMDPSFDEKRSADEITDQFFRIQGAWANNDVSVVRNLLTEEMFKLIGDDIAKLKADKKINKLENITVRSIDLVEAWQESGRDFITVRFYANLLDYTVDETTGQVAFGSKTEPVKFEEYWTFTRPVGNHPWQLSAISQVGS